MTLQEEDAVRPGRRITLLFIAVGSIFGFFATILGALLLANLSGIHDVPSVSLYSDHAYLQIFGFLSEFVCGVAYSVIPLFKSKKLTNPNTAYIIFSLITAANLLGIAAIFIGGSYYSSLFKIFSFLILISSAFFCYQILDVLSGPRSLGEAESFLSMATISFVLISVIFFAATTFPQLLNAEDLFGTGFLYLSLIGFAGSMIFGVELRTVAFRMTNYRKSFAKPAALLQAVSIALAFLSSFRDFGVLGDFSGVTFLSSAVCFAISIRIFEGRKQSRVMLPLTSSRPNVATHNSISDYTDACILSSVLWLVFGLALGIFWQFHDSTNFWIRDSFIHTLAIGFIGSTITAYGPVLLPGVLMDKAPRKHLSLIPLLLLNIGLLIRIGGNFYSTLFPSGPPMWESLSGLAIIAAIVILMKNLHFREAGE